MPYHTGKKKEKSQRWDEKEEKENGQKEMRKRRKPYDI